MAFRFNFTNEDIGIDNASDPSADQSIDQSFSELSICDSSVRKDPCHAVDISSLSLPGTIQTDQLEIVPNNAPLYKRTLSDVKFQMAEQDTLVDHDGSEQNQTMDMLKASQNNDLIRGVYEGGFKTWECSVDLVQFLAKLPSVDICGKRVLEIGCGSALPSLYLLSVDQSNLVDVQDYNEQVIRYITIPNVLVNTLLKPQEHAQEETQDTDQEVDDQDGDNASDNDDEEDADDDDIIGDSDSCDAEFSVPADRAVDLLNTICKRTRAFIGDWSGLPIALNISDNSMRYDMIVTSETIYAEHALPDLIKVFLTSLKKPSGIGLVAAKTIYFGVGGGILPFCHLLETSIDENGDRLKVEKVFESESTVKREILKVTWAQK